MKKRRNWLTAALACTALSAGLTLPSQAAEAFLKAFPSRNPIYVDGQKVDVEAYTINGYNYVKLGDLSSLVGFELSYDSATNSVYIGEPPVQEAAAQEAATQGAIKLPEGDAKLNLKEGDKVFCDDGYVYEITNMKRYNYSAFLGGPLPELPSPTCDWSRYPALELPKMEVRHSYSEGRHHLFIRNLYETRRMQYTLYNAMGTQPLAWENGTCVVNFHLSIPAERGEDASAFWPWRDSELTKFANTRPVSNFYFEAWDYYLDGVFQHTRYYVA